MNASVAVQGEGVVAVVGVDVGVDVGVHCHHHVPGSCLLLPRGHQEIKSYHEAKTQESLAAYLAGPPPEGTTTHLLSGSRLEMNAVGDLDQY